MRRTLLALLLLGAVSAPAHAQRGALAVPPRPAFPLPADTNDAQAYYNHGMRTLERQPAEAAAAFYWASRLNPGWADPLYARRAAILLSNEQRLVDYYNGQRSVRRSPEIRHADSLYVRAVAMDPMLHQKFDKPLQTRALEVGMEKDYERAGYSMGGSNTAAVNDMVHRYMITGPAWWRAWIAYSDGRMAEAASLYERAIGEARGNKSGLYADRARALYLMGADSAALASMTRAVAEWRRAAEDGNDVVWFYASKGLLEHSVGMIHERMGNRDAAREAYGRALQEDLSYHPAHVRLARLALAAGDTATAVSEMDLAVQIRGDDAVLRTEYALVLVGARRFVDAAGEFRKATELEPYYAAPYLYLARLYDASGMKEDAAANYAAFVARSPQRDPQLAPSRARLAELSAALQAEREADARTAAAPAPQAAPAPETAAPEVKP